MNINAHITRQPAMLQKQWQCNRKICSSFKELCRSMIPCPLAEAGSYMLVNWMSVEACAPAVLQRLRTQGLELTWRCHGENDDSSKELRSLRVGHEACLLRQDPAPYRYYYCCVCEGQGSRPTINASANPDQPATAARLQRQDPACWRSATLEAHI